MVSIMELRENAYPSKFGARMYLEGIFYVLFGAYSAWYDYQIVFDQYIPVPDKSVFFTDLIFSKSKSVKITDLA